MKKFLKIISATMAFCSGFSLHAAAFTVKGVVNPDYYDELMSKGMIRVFHEAQDESLVLVPDSAYKSSCLENVVEKQPGKFSMVAENLYLIPKADLQAQSGSASARFTIEDVSRIFRSISKMKGMEYYSLNQHRQKVLYKEAYTIDNAENRNQIADRTEGSADGNVYYAFQHDDSFGKCAYEFSFRQSADELFFVSKNLDTLGFGMVKAVSPGDMLVSAIVVDCGDAFVLYFKTDVDSVKAAGIKKTMMNSIIGRMDALKTWFFGQF